MTATATKKRTKLKLGTDFGPVSVGDETASIGVRFSKEELNVVAAEEMLCGRRLDISIVALMDGEQDGQKRMAGMERPELKCVVDVKKYGSSPKWITARLKFALELVDLDTLVKFAKRRGNLTILATEELSLPNDDEDGEDAAEE